MAILELCFGIWEGPGSPITSGYADGHRVQMYVSITNTEGVMVILMIPWSRGGHIGFYKMPLDEILHTLRKMLSQTIMNSYQSTEKVCTTIPLSWPQRLNQPDPASGPQRLKMPEIQVHYNIAHQ